MLSESFFGSFCSQKEQFHTVAKNGFQITESKMSEAKFKRTVPARSQ
jgi:cell fate (sporulation/competence/biofilm development) regulator YlbF (YheA/YmcA/DUF963 family)